MRKKLLYVKFMIQESNTLLKKATVTITWELIFKIMNGEVFITK